MSDQHRPNPIGTTISTLGHESELAAVRARREAIYQAIVGLEDALATPVGDWERFRLRVAMAVDHARARLHEHIAETEQPNGFLDQVEADEPRLCRRVGQLRVDHERLDSGVQALADALRTIDEPGGGEEAAEARSVALRNQAVEFLGELARHRQRGADLIYEAYNVDIGHSE